jgi:hypothetical protein
MNDEPLEIIFDNQSVIDEGNIKLGRLVASSNENEDWHKYNLQINNNSRNDLVNIALETNLNEELFRLDLPSQLSGKESADVILYLRASRLLSADLKGKPYLFIKYKEVKHF